MNLKTIENHLLIKTQVKRVERISRVRREGRTSMCVRERKVYTVRVSERERDNVDVEKGTEGVANKQGTHFTFFNVCKCESGWWPCPCNATGYKLQIN